MGWLGISALVLMNAGLFVNLGYPKVAFVLIVIGAFGIVVGAVYLALRLFCVKSCFSPQCWPYAAFPDAARLSLTLYGSWHAVSQPVRNLSVKIDQFILVQSFDRWQAAAEIGAQPEAVIPAETADPHPFDRDAAPWRKA